jgi:CheY-like chemotaxis protein
MKREGPILVIEDEPSVIAFIQAALERSGYAVVPVSSGAAALPLLQTGGYRGIISDMRTPGGITGADVHAWVAANRPELLGRIIFITGDTVNEDTRRLLNDTGAPFIEKPFRVNQLISAVGEYFGAPEGRHSA